MKKHVCPTCEFEFIRSKEDRYTVEKRDPIFSMAYYDAWDCPACGGQCLGLERYLEFEEEEKQQRGYSFHTIMMDEFETKKEEEQEERCEKALQDFRNKIEKSDNIEDIVAACCVFYDEMNEQLGKDCDI